MSAVLSVIEKLINEEHSPEFKSWFGNSKVRDKQGKPLTVYHGTAAGTFHKFKVSVPKTPGGEDLKGAYFTGDQNAAYGYAARARREGRGTKTGILKAHLKIEHPLETAPIIKSYRKKGMTFGDAKRAALKHFDPKVHDGVIFSGDTYNPPEYVVTHPHQVRFAT